MISLRSGRTTAPPPRSLPAPTRRRAPAGAPLWSSDSVLWGIVRLEGCFDVGDTDHHAGIVQHAFPHGRDWHAACGFRTPLQKAFDGVRRPLLSMPGAHNPRCGACVTLVVRVVEPILDPRGWAAGPAGWIEHRLDPPTPAMADPRSLRPAVSIPVHLPDQGTATQGWPATDRAPVRAEDRLRVIEVWRRAAKESAAPAEPEQVETAGPVGRRAFMEFDRAERIQR